MFNPDYPTSTNPGGFLRHTYQQPQQNDLYYYAGGNMGFGGVMPPQCDSRRNVCNPVNPFTQQFGQTQQTNAVPETAVQPFASYPPATPMQNMGLNGMIESRRNVPTPIVGQSNPWLQQQAQPQMPMMPMQNNQFNPLPGAPTGGWFDPGFIPGYKVDLSMAALYGDNKFGFDKHNAWENYYTQNRTLPMPNINWNAAAQPQGYYNQPMTPQYPVQQFPTSQANWKEIAEKNWGSSNL